jgi:hypothetical protein
MGQVCGCGHGCNADEDRAQRRPHSRRNSFSLNKNQVYHLNHVECHPYQGRRSRYSIQSTSFLGLLTRRSSSNRSTHHGSVAGSHGVQHQDSLASPSSALHRDTSETSSNPILLHQHQDSGAVVSDPLARQPSLSELQHGMSYDEFRRSGVNRVFRSYLDYQAVRQSYLLAMYDESLLDSGEQQECSHSHTRSLSMAFPLPLYLISFLFCQSHAMTTLT